MHVGRGPGRGRGQARLRTGPRRRAGPRAPGRPRAPLRHGGGVRGRPRQPRHGRRRAGWRARRLLRRRHRGRIHVLRPRDRRRVRGGRPLHGARARARGRGERAEHGARALGRPQQRVRRGVVEPGHLRVRVGRGRRLGRRRNRRAAAPRETLLLRRLRARRPRRGGRRGALPAGLPLLRLPLRARARACGRGRRASRGPGRPGRPDRGPRAAGDRQRGRPAEVLPDERHRRRGRPRGRLRPPAGLGRGLPAPHGRHRPPAGSRRPVLRAGRRAHRRRAGVLGVVRARDDGPVRGLGRRRVDVLALDAERRRLARLAPERDPRPRRREQLRQRPAVLRLLDAECAGLRRGLGRRRPHLLRPLGLAPDF
mmetsp:Transcript_24871/g.74612  ORF Transcript_24871/g.74612 Transcript_24871/m.74612 type:complete len:368 (+) Transcript_24871:616-1719(+)